MRDMERTRKRAIAWIVGGAFYSAAALIMSIAWGWSWAAAFIPLVYMLCAAACFELGREYRDYQFAVYYGTEEEEVGQDLVWMEEANGIQTVNCKRCNGVFFRMVAGRLVCNTCGEVMEEDHG